jgi:hypothetical protein
VSVTKLAVAKKEVAPTPAHTPARGPHKTVAVAKNEPAPVNAPARKGAAVAKAPAKKEAAKPTLTLAARKQTHPHSRLALR